MFDKLKSIFIVDDDKGKTSTSKAEQKAPQQKGSNRQPKTNTPRRTAAPSAGKVTTKFMEVLLRAMEANNLEGFDYLEFKQSLKSLEKMPMDEPTRFKSAFAMAQTMGATPDNLIKTANHYVRVLLKEQEKFGQALANQRSKQIGDKEGHIKQLASVIEEKKKKIEQLKKEIAEHSKGMEAMKNEIEDAVVKVDTTKNDFQASFNSLVSKIKKDIESMKLHLK